ncbi:Ubiquinone biosynthesis protein COQ9, mitochondrial [Pichia kudriavzevii]|nr:Ubiquinone biosynthesis protein COQ9, mitochondrial [Pichia kudriavzevii]
MLGTMILPSNVLQSLKELHNLSDDISYYAGDRSIDFAWYSKRMSISQLFVLSELFMVNDTSAGYQDTYKFVDNKLKEILTAGYIYNSVEEWTFFNAVSLVNIIKSQLARG